MRYTSLDYLRDGFWPLDYFLFILDKISPYFRLLLLKLKLILKRFVNWVINFEFEEYLFRITENLPYGIFIVFLGFWAVVTLARFTEKENGVRIATITTNSMSPEIAPGSLIVSIPQKSYTKGEIITFKEVNLSTGYPTGRLVTHRIIDRRVGGGVNFITKGDANEYPDPGIVKKDQISGKVEIIIPYLGYLDVILRSIPGFLIFIVVPSFLIIKNELAYLKSNAGNYKRVTSPV